MNHHFLSGVCTRCGEPRANLAEHSHCSGGFESAATTAVKDRPNLATMGERLGAHLIDVAVLIALAVVGFSLAQGMAPWALMLPVGALFSYRLLCDGLSGRSIGKRLVGTQTIHRESDSACGYLRSIVRNASLAFGIVDAAFIFGRDRRRIGDYLAGTDVIRLRRREEPRPQRCGALSKKLRRAAHVILPLAFVGFAVLGLRSRHQTNAYLFNGLPIPVEVTLRDETYSLSAEEHLKLYRVEEGPALVRVHDLDGRLIEEQEVEVPARYDLVAYNVAGAAPLYLRQEFYSEDHVEAPDGDFVTLAGERWVTRESMQYVMEPTPDEYYLDYDEEYRGVWSFDVEEGGPIEGLWSLSYEECEEDAISLAKRIMAAVPQDEGLAVEMLEFLAEELDARAYEECFADALKRLPASIALHHKQQDRMLWDGEVDAVRELYAELLESDPGSAVFGYLNARVTPLPESLELTSGLLERFPEDSFILTRHGWGLHHTGEFAAAQAIFVRARELSSEWSFTLLDLEARNLVALELPQQAIELASEYGSSDSYHEEPFMKLFAKLHQARDKDSPARVGLAEPVVEAMDKCYEERDSGLEAWMILVSGAEVSTEQVQQAEQRSDQQIATELARKLEVWPGDAALYYWEVAEGLDLGFLDENRRIVLACALLSTGESDEARAILSTVNIPAHVLEDSILESEATNYTLELDWEVRALLELFEALEQPRGSEERAAGFARAREYDFMGGFASRAASRWEDGR